MRRTIIFRGDPGESGDPSGRRLVAFTAHAVERIISRRVPVDDVVSAIRTGEVVEDYAASRPHPTRLLLVHVDQRPLHVVVTERLGEGVILVVTIYEPETGEWHPGFRRRR